MRAQSAGALSLEQIERAHTDRITPLHAARTALDQRAGELEGELRTTERELRTTEDDDAEALLRGKAPSARLGELQARAQQTKAALALVPRERARLFEQEGQATVEAARWAVPQVQAIHRQREDELRAALEAALESAARVRESHEAMCRIGGRGQGKTVDPMPPIVLNRLRSIIGEIDRQRAAPVSPGNELVSVRVLRRWSNVRMTARQRKRLAELPELAWRFEHYSAGEICGFTPEEAALLVELQVAEAFTMPSEPAPDPDIDPKGHAVWREKFQLTPESWRRAHPDAEPAGVTT